MVRTQEASLTSNPHCQFVRSTGAIPLVQSWHPFSSGEMGQTRIKLSSIHRRRPKQFQFLVPPPWANSVNLLPLQRTQCIHPMHWVQMRCTAPLQLGGWTDTWSNTIVPVRPALLPEQIEAGKPEHQVQVQTPAAVAFDGSLPEGMKSLIEVFELRGETMQAQRTC